VRHHSASSLTARCAADVRLTLAGKSRAARAKVQSQSSPPRIILQPPKICWNLA